MMIAKLGGKQPIVEMFKGKRILDVGCGDGDFLENDPTNFIGIDINDELLHIAREKGFKVIKASTLHIPFSDNSFDGCFCRYLIEHLNPSEAHQMFLEISRVLKPGGKIVIETEMPTKKFWNTFSHIRPYPPEAIKKLMTLERLETFQTLKNIRIEKVFYLGGYHKHKILNWVCTFIANYLGLRRRSYVMILVKEH